MMNRYEEFVQGSLEWLVKARESEDYVAKELQVEIAKVQALLAVAEAIKNTGPTIQNRMQNRRR
jgi:hypothetical protein